MKDINIKINPSIIYFTHSKIRSTFSGCNKTIYQTISEIENDITVIKNIPLILVEFDGYHYYSTNNRRLFLYKYLYNNNSIKEIDIRLRTVPKTKYSNKTYSLIARVCKN
jgi:hypothetical protein